MKFLSNALLTNYAKGKRVFTTEAPFELKEQLDTANFPQLGELLCSL